MSKNNVFINRIIGFSFASWVNALITLITTPIVTSLFEPVELGKITLFISYANILVPFVYMGFDQAYVRFYNEPVGRNDKYSMFKLCSAITLGFSCIVSLVILCFWKYFSTRIIGYPNLLLSASLATYVFAFLLSRKCGLKCRMDNDVKMFSIQSILATIIIKVSFVAVVIVRPEAELAIYLRSFLLLFCFIVFFYIAWRKCGNAVIDKSRSVIKELSKFAVPLFPTTFLVMLNVSLSQVMLNHYADFYSIGIYANAITIAGIITIIQSGLNSFWTPFVYEYYKDEHKIQTMHKIFSLLMFLFAFLIIITQDLIYLVLVNKTFWESKYILAILLVSPVCEVIAETLGLGIELSKKTYLKLPVYVINILVNITACVFLIPLYGIWGAAMANGLASLSMLLVKALIGERYYRCSDNYFSLIVSMAILILSGFVNYYAHKYIHIYVALAMMCIFMLYRKESQILIKNIQIYFNRKER